MLWKKLLAPVLLTIALATAAVSAASAAGAPAAPDTIEAQAAPAQAAPTPARVTDPAVACQTPNLNVALPPLCALWSGGTLTPDQKEAIGKIIVRVANIAVHRPIVKARLVERCERYLAAHPGDTGLRARICHRIVAGESLTPDELRSLREAGAAAQNGQDGQHRLRPGTLRPRPTVTPTPTN